MWERQLFYYQKGRGVSGRYAKRGCSDSLENDIGENWWPKRFWMLRRTQHYDADNFWGAVDMGKHFWQGGKKKKKILPWGKDNVSRENWYVWLCWKIGPSLTMWALLSKNQWFTLLRLPKSHSLPEREQRQPRHKCNTTKAVR